MFGTYNTYTKYAKNINVLIKCFPEYFAQKTPRIIAVQIVLIRNNLEMIIEDIKAQSIIKNVVYWIV